MEAKIYSLLKENKTSELIEEIKADDALLNFVDAKGVSLLTLSFYFGNKVLSDFILLRRQPKDIYEATIAGMSELVSAMLDENPKLLNSYSADGFTPLGLAAFFGRVEIAKTLILKNADPNIPAANAFKVAPIHSSVAANNYEITQLLLEHGANPNATQQKNVTPLHSAAHLGNAKIAALLLEHGADKNALTENGQTAHSMAQEVKAEEVMRILS